MTWVWIGVVVIQAVLLAVVLRRVADLSQRSLRTREEASREAARAVRAEAELRDVRTALEAERGRSGRLTEELEAERGGSGRLTEELEEARRRVARAVATVLPAPPPAEPARAPSTDPAVVPERLDVLADIESRHWREPQVLADSPEPVHDLALDAGRLGGLVIRAAALRGPRSSRVRRQVTTTTLVAGLRPTVLLSVVAAGHPGGSVSHLGAAFANTCVFGQVIERRQVIDSTWRGVVEDFGGREQAMDTLRAALGQVLEALRAPVLEVARRRAEPPSAVATDVVCLLTRLGDGDRRHHVAFGTGSGRVGLVRGDGLVEVYAAPRGALPEDALAVDVACFDSGPDDVVVVCSQTTHEFIRRNVDQFGRWPTAPGPAAFLAWLGSDGDVYGEDRAMVCLWETARHGVPAVR
ncbi:MAG TPA: hypothetical protein VI248_05025 [Kineosporiaceae bacterium]